MFQVLNTETLSKVENSGLPYFLFTEQQQKGNTFGERYVNAIQSVFQKGFENVITIGNDTPHLKTEHLREAAKNVNKATTVLGPSNDGGYYLLGINKSQFNAQLFLKLPWQTAKLNAQIARLLRSKNIQINWLERLCDIDTVTDLKTVSQSFKSISLTLKTILLSLIISENYVVELAETFIQKYLQKTHFNKGSPLLLPL